jgi:hypothetical protein
VQERELGQITKQAKKCWADTSQEAPRLLNAPQVLEKDDAFIDGHWRGCEKTSVAGKWVTGAEK